MCSRKVKGKNIYFGDVDIEVVFKLNTSNWGVVACYGEKTLSFRFNHLPYTSKHTTVIMINVCVQIRKNNHSHYPCNN